MRTKPVIEVVESKELDPMDFAPKECLHGHSSIFDCYLCALETGLRMKAKDEGKSGRGEN